MFCLFPAYLHHSSLLLLFAAHKPHYKLNLNSEEIHEVCQIRQGSILVVKKYFSQPHRYIYFTLFNEKSSKCSSAKKFRLMILTIQEPGYQTKNEGSEKESRTNVSNRHVAGLQSERARTEPKWTRNWH